MWYWEIRHEDKGLVMAGLAPYATEELAREASRRERLDHGWTMADRYYDHAYEVKDDAVVLGARNQTVLAELACLLRQFVHEMRGGEGDYSESQLFNDLWDWVMRYDVTPQDLDHIYDVLHRSGANR